MAGLSARFPKNLQAICFSNPVAAETNLILALSSCHETQKHHPQTINQKTQKFPNTHGRESEWETLGKESDLSESKRRETRETYKFHTKKSVARKQQKSPGLAQGHGQHSRGGPIQARGGARAPQAQPPRQGLHGLRGLHVWGLPTAGAFRRLGLGLQGEEGPKTRGKGPQKPEAARRILKKTQRFMKLKQCQPVLGWLWFLPRLCFTAFCVPTGEQADLTSNLKPAKLHKSDSLEKA